MKRIDCHVDHMGNGESASELTELAGAYFFLLPQGEPYKGAFGFALKVIEEGTVFSVTHFRILQGFEQFCPKEMAGMACSHGGSICIIG